jgi:hypothetical protein
MRIFGGKATNSEPESRHIYINFKRWGKVQGNVKNNYDFIFFSKLRG